MHIYSVKHLLCETSNKAAVAAVYSMKVFVCKLFTGMLTLISGCLQVC